MKNIKILTEGPVSYNGRAFLQPIILNKRKLLDYSVKVNFVYKLSSDIVDCDLLIIDSKFFREWWLTRKQEIFESLDKLNKNTNIIFFDTTDSSGYILGEILPFVKSYYKHQALVKKENYLKPMYGRRLFTDFYHRELGIIDDPAHLEDSVQVSHIDDLKKIKVFWNTGMANYSLTGDYLGKIYRKLPIKGILRYPSNFTEPSISRPYDVQCRFGSFYNKETVAYQRKAISKLLHDRLRTKKVNRYSFYRELKLSKIVMSPFGLGEITLKDFEVFLSGSLLLKPNMDHMTTWPNFYTSNTYASFDWDLSNLKETLESILDNYKEYIELAQNGQDTYRYYIATTEGNVEFLKRFKDIVFSESAQ